MVTPTPSPWRARAGIALAVLLLVLAVLLTSGLPVVLDLRPAILGVGTAAALVLAGSRARTVRRGLWTGAAVLAGLASL